MKFPNLSNFNMPRKNSVKKTKKPVSQRAMPRKKKDKLTGNHTPRVAPYWWNKKVKGEKAIRSCPRCGAVYFDKHWHIVPDFWAEYKKIFPADRKNVIEELCAECKWIDSGKEDTEWEGEVILKNLVDADKNEILNLVRNIGARAFRRDPEDQIIKIEDRGREVVITTTENQLAVSIGKQIARAFKGGKLEIIWSDEDAPARVRWTRKGI